MIFSIVIFLQYRIQRPISVLASHMGQVAELPEDLKKKARQRLLNLPFFIALINLITYTVMPAIVVLVFYLFREIPLTICLFLFFRAFMIGLIAASLSVFLVEAHSRETLIPLFFPKGRLASIPGTVRVPFLRRIRLLNMAGTLNPMLLLLITLLLVVWETEEKTIPAAQLSREIFLFCLILCGIFVIIALSLNLLVGNSIRTPIKEMLRVVEKVEHGDFTQKVKVLSNDEIGVLGDAGNDMIRGLSDRERIREAFGKYVTPEIRDQILAGRIPLNGERTEATMLFSDLRDFTSYVEENSPEEVIRSMRAYFTDMEKAIRAHKGLVLQYVGDEIEAVFGVPLRDECHTDKALLAALEMRKSLEELNKLRLEEGKNPFRHGIGIHTGEVLAGNTGSEDRLSYALIGDTVNLASRIQGLTKIFHCDILVSEQTVKGLRNSFQIEKESPHMVKGYSKPITVYRIL